MKIDLNQEFENADGTKTGLFLKDILIGSLLDGRAPDDEKIKRYSLYRDVKKSKVGFIDINVEDVALLKKIVLSTQSTLVVGQAHEMLETPYSSPAPEAA
jgi:hypothetical protein